jgi:hypothetical protein
MLLFTFCPSFAHINTVLRCLPAVTALPSSQDNDTFSPRQQAYLGVTALLSWRDSVTVLA